MDYRTQPKIELHLHLDCSLSFDVVRQLDPGISEEQYQAEFISPPKCRDLADYIKRAVKGVELMQTKEQLRLVTLDLFMQLKADNVLYAEIRFAPLQHIFNGLSPTEVVAEVNAATEEATQEFGIEAGIILCTLRHYSEAQSLETVALVEKFRGTRVVGFDIAADEAGFPIANHMPAFKFAHDNNICCTAHAGEARGADSVWETLINLQPSRIGHGVRCTEDPALISYLREHQVHLEVCPTSNIQVNVFESIEQHSINEIYTSGVSMSINTDARTISNVTLSTEYDLVSTVFNWTEDDFKKCNLEAIDHSFAAAQIKEKVRAKVEAAYG